MRCEEPMKIIELLRLWEQGYTQREIAASVNCSKSTVAGLQKRLQEIGLSYEAAKGMTDEAVTKLAYPAFRGGRPAKNEPISIMGVYVFTTYYLMKLIAGFKTRR